MHAPDLYDGRTFATLEEGIAHAEGLGVAAIADRGAAIAESLLAGLVYIGFSLGVVAAQKLAMTRPGAAGAVFVEACVPVKFFGGTWPAGVPVQVHAMADDPIFDDEGDREAAEALVATANQAELFLYPGDRHLFADPSLASYDAEAAGLLHTRVLGFLRSV